MLSLIIFVILGILTFLAILLIVGILSPQHIYIERRKLVQADPDVVFREIADFHQFVTWNPWTRKDPEIQQHFEGEAMTVGSKYSWQGNKKVGKGYMLITAIDAPEKVEMDLNFGPSGTANCGFELEKQENGTLVVWYFKSDMGKNPFARSFGRMMERFVGNDFAQGLENLSLKFNSK